MKRWYSRKKGPRPNLPARSSRIGSRRRWLGLFRRIGMFTTVVGFIGLVGWAGVEGYRGAVPYAMKWFAVKEITISGNNQVTRREILERLSLKPNETLLSLNPRRLEIRLEAHPWIKQATVSRRLLHTVMVHIVERRAAAVLRSSSMALLLDEEGRALSLLPESTDPGLPVLVGLNPKGVLDGETNLLRAARRGIEVAHLLSRTFEGRPEVDVGNPDNTVAYVEGIRFQFGTSSFEEKWDRYRRMEAFLPSSTRESRNDIDLRYAGKVIVRERVSGNGTAEFQAARARQRSARI
ncbi:MAG: hypothetical protein C4293_16110 [Nitrospiraceae bacterium]